MAGTSKYLSCRITGCENGPNQVYIYELCTVINLPADNCCCLSLICCICTVSQNVPLRCVCCVCCECVWQLWASNHPFSVKILSFRRAEFIEGNTECQAGPQLSVVLASAEWHLQLSECCSIDFRGTCFVPVILKILSSVPVILRQNGREQNILSNFTPLRRMTLAHRRKVHSAHVYLDHSRANNGTF